MTPEIEQEVRDYLRDLKDEKRWIRELFDKIQEKIHSHERDDEGRHVEILERLSGLAARATVAELELRSVRSSVDKLDTALSEVRTDAGSWRVPVAELVQDRKQRSSWRRLWHRGTLDTVSKILLILISAVVGASIRHALH